MNELIDALRCYGKVVPMECPNMDCKYNVLGTCERERMARDAADAIERLVAEVDKLQKEKAELAKDEEYARNLCNKRAILRDEYRDLLLRFEAQGMRDSAKMVTIKDDLIQRICENCETTPDVRLRVCGECPIIQPIREVFDEQQS